MKNKKYSLFILGLLLIPGLALAESSDSDVSIGFALMMEAFVSIHMSLFVILPLSKIIDPTGNKKMFLKLFFIRVALLLIFDFYITTDIAFADFFFVFIGAFVIVPISLGANQKKNKSQIDSLPTVTTNASVNLSCTKCGATMQVTDKVCPNCGEPFAGNNVAVTNKIFVRSTDFSPVYDKDEELLLEEFINREIIKCNLNINSPLLPEGILKRKKVLNIIFAVLLFVYISLIFFHFPVYTYIIGAIILTVFLVLSKKFDLMDYLKKEIKSRPGEKISNIIMTTSNNLFEDNSRKIMIFTCICAVILPLIIFYKPRIFYEKIEGGYGVRFYAYGLTNSKTATIPSTYKGSDVISLRGNTFSNMPFLETVTLPDTIVEIRGQAFKNDYNLKNVNIPVNLEYLGGGAFYNCKSIKEISLPDTLTTMGGDTFHGAYGLEKVKLSSNITEIRGNTFEDCISLTSIDIPDKVTRIGGHAFYGNSSLTKVYISENSALTEIGSSAFRRCSKLYEITIPANTYVNERAFKESPTVVHRYGSLENDSNYNDNGYSGFSYNNNLVNENKDNSLIDSGEKNISVSYKETDERFYNLVKGNKVLFKKYDLTVEYVGLVFSDAQLMVTYNGNTKEVLVDANENILNYYAVGDYLLKFDKDNNEEIFVYVQKMVPSLPGYKYYINATRSDKEDKIVVSSENMTYLYIDIGDIENIDNNNFLNINLSGYNNKKIKLSDGEEYEYGNVKIDMRLLDKDYYYLVVYVK